MATAIIAIVSNHQQKKKKTEDQEGLQKLNCKSICQQLQQKNQRLGKAYQDLKAQFDELEDSCQEREEHLAQAQQDADEMADMVRKNPSMVCGSAIYPEREEMQPKQRLQTRRHNTQHDKRLHRDSRAKNCQ